MLGSGQATASILLDPGACEFNATLGLKGVYHTSLACRSVTKARTGVLLVPVGSPRRCSLEPVGSLYGPPTTPAIVRWSRGAVIHCDWKKVTFESSQCYVEGQHGSFLSRRTVISRQYCNHHKVGTLKALCHRPSPNRYSPFRPHGHPSQKSDKWCCDCSRTIAITASFCQQTAFSQLRPIAFNGPLLLVQNRTLHAARPIT